MWNSYKRYNIYIRRVSEGKERGKGTEEILEAITTEKNPKLILYTEPLIKKSQRTPKKIYEKKNASHMISKL